MAWHRIGDKPLSEPMLTRFNDPYMRHRGRWVDRWFVWLIINLILTFVSYPFYTSRDHYVYVPSQWETTLYYNSISHWLCTYTKWSLHYRCANFLKKPTAVANLLICNSNSTDMILCWYSEAMINQFVFVVVGSIIMPNMNWAHAALWLEEHWHHGGTQGWVGGGTATQMD